jgi:hypothetical protein
MSIYKQAHYAQPSAHMVRFALRLDGFASINAPFRGGEFTTRPFTFTGKNLEINFSTGASGSIQFELQDATGKPIPGFTLEEAPETIGDQVDRIVRWKGDRDLASLSGQPVRLQAVMKDADLYSIRFVE